MSQPTTKKRRPRKDAHVVGRGWGDTMGAECLHCGAKLQVQLPIDVETMGAALRAFVKRHKDCPKPEERP